jgi:hypothetical protein
MDIIKKSNPIKINKNNQYNYADEFNLKTICFDPTKFSPPNDFLIKLNLRIENYNSLRSRFSE